MRERHNKILERLVKAIPADLGDKFKEQKPLRFPGDLRPDLVVHNRNSGEVTIIDVTIPFESDKDAFDKARNEKAQKYSPLVTWYQDQEHIKKVYYETFVDFSLTQSKDHIEFGSLANNELNILEN